jgi:biotin transport system ATP-binding protein
MTIRFEGVAVRLPTADGEVLALDGIDLTLSERRIALIGGNGSGKSTLARLVNGLVRPSSGRVVVEGLDVASQAREVRRRVGFVFTDPAAQLVMPTALEDVALSLRRFERSHEGRRTAAARVLADYGLGGLGDRSVHALSGGQRQLLALAGVLATRPSVLVADEPTTLLDLANSRMIGDLLLSLEQQLILVTHDLELAARCDRAVLIAGGRVAADGSPAEVVATYRASV